MSTIKADPGLTSFYGHSVCEAKINPAPKSIAKKLVTKVSPVAAKDTIMAPRVSAPALMCFGSIINWASYINVNAGGKRHAVYEHPEKYDQMFYGLLLS